MTNADSPPPLEPLHTLQQVCEAMKMSDRWLRGQIKDGGVEHTRLGHKIRFTEDQYQALLEQHRAPVATPPRLSITTGPRRKTI